MLKFFGEDYLVVWSKVIQITHVFSALCFFQNCSCFFAKCHLVGVPYPEIKVGWWSWFSIGSKEKIVDRYILIQLLDSVVLALVLTFV